MVGSFCAMSGQVIVHCPAEQRWLRFADPLEIVSARTPAEVLPAVRRVEEKVHTRRLYAAGYVSYEAAPAFDAALLVRSASRSLGVPLIWFGLYKRSEPIELPWLHQPVVPIEQWQPTVTSDEYERTIKAIKDHIAAGRTYQVNYTYRLRAAFTGDPWAFFLHLARLQDSADYFGYQFDPAAWLDRLEEVSQSLAPVDHKVRASLTRTGVLSISATPLSEISRPAAQRVALAQHPIDSNDIFLYHKTSRRLAYERACAAQPDGDEVILWNERGEITESCTANVVIELNGERITPPIECGLLGGTFRGWLCDHGQIAERVMTIEMLRSARRIYLINSVRQWMDARLIE